MKDDFYTLGGGHFWEDLFFYQKWRIQRNTLTKKCRLLDNWDIRRFEGSFEDCRKAFVDYIEAYEIARQHGHMVVMIHGLGQSKNIFKPLWREALANGFLAAAVNYPSTQKDLEGHVKQFHFFLNHLEDVESVSFVSYGAGSLILQRLFENSADWQTKLHLSRAVAVAPCVSGSSLLNKIAQTKFGGFVIGPMGKDLAPEKIRRIDAKVSVETGVITTNKPVTEKIFERLMRCTVPEKSLEEIKHQLNASDILRIEDHHFNIFKNDRVCRKVISFLQRGKF